MTKGWDQPSKVELDAALRSMVREIGLAGSKAGMHTEAVDLELRFTIEVESDGEVRPVVHLGGAPPDSEVHLVRVALRPKAVSTYPLGRSGTSTEVDLSAAAKEAVTRAASERRDRGAAASPAPPSPPPEPEPNPAAAPAENAAPPAPQVHAAVRPRLKLRMATTEPSQPDPAKDEPAYRSEVSVEPQQGPVVEERRANAVTVPRPVVEERRERRDSPEPPAAPEPSKRPAVPHQFVVFDSQRARQPEVSIEMLDTAEFADEELAADTMVTDIPPGRSEETEA